MHELCSCGCMPGFDGLSGWVWRAVRALAGCRGVVRDCELHVSGGAVPGERPRARAAAVIWSEAPIERPVLY